jgi:hypothetical protein
VNYLISNTPEKPRYADLQMKTSVDAMLPFPENPPLSKVNV